mmetsp:Transcript_10608/g.29837  ORF Transcript_10608/g.29837 Transcript_10608/m.29837 type:complete len:348 (+) Transcript_10608:63-1106(+)
MPIVWCAQQLIFEGSPASIARIIELVRAVRYPTRDMGVLPHQQIAFRIGAKEEALLWRGNRTASDADTTSDAEDDSSQEQQNQELYPQADNNLGYTRGDEFFFDFQLSTSYPTYSPHLTRRICFNGKCHKIISAKPLENDSTTHRSCCKLAVYCSEICLKDHTGEHESQCQASDQHINRPNVKIHHLALTAADKENNANIQRTIRLCVYSLLKKGDEAFKNDNLTKDAGTAYHVLSKSCPYLISHILSFVGIGEGGMEGRETCTSITWLNQGGAAYDYTKISALAKQYGCQVKYLHATCDILPGERPKAKLIVSPSGELLHESGGSLRCADVEDGGEFRWVATNGAD